MTRYHLLLEDEFGKQRIIYPDVQELALDRAFPRMEISGAIRDGMLSMDKERTREQTRHVPTESEVPVKVSKKANQKHRKEDGHARD